MAEKNLKFIQDYPAAVKTESETQAVHCVSVSVVNSFSKLYQFRHIPLPTLAIRGNDSVAELFSVVLPVCISLQA